MATEDPTLELLKSVDIYLENFKYLNNIDIHSDDVPNIQHTSVAVGVETSHSSSSIVSDDYKGYSYATFELGFIVKLENEYRFGQEFIHMLYTYRSVSQAIPEIAIETHEDATPEEQAEVVAKKAEISRKVLDILRPEIAKLKDLMSYVSNATHLFHTVVSYLIQKESQKEIIPEGIFYSLMKLLDVLIILDNIKDIKTCLQKDFSRYKRVLGPHPSIEVIEELNQLQLFLSNPDPKKSKNYIFLSLRDEIKRINNHDSILFQIIELANEALDNIMYLTPDEKFRLIRIQPYLMLIIDSDADDDKSTNSINIFKTNKTKLAVIQKLFHKNPVIPLYGDMSITLEFILQRSSHYDKNVSANWSTESSNADAKVVAHYSVATHWNAIRDSSTAYLLRMQMAVNRCEKYPFSKVLDEVSIETAADVFNMISEGFQKLSKWTMIVQSNIVWKYTHPVSNAQLTEMKISLNTDGIEYARVLKHNFTKTELSILIDVISCIKSVSSMMSKYESLFAPFIRFHIHHAIQQLVQGDLVPLLHRVDKRNKPILPTLLKLRTLAADYAKGTVDTQRDYKEYTRKDGYTLVAHPARVVGTSATQLYILRLQVSLLCDSNSEVRQKSSMFSKADLEKADIEIFSNFYNDSFYFPYLLDYSETLRSVSNLGSLWYREFYLEMTKCIQFPIEMSLPWILTEHIITNHTQTNSVMLNNVFYILDIYNDAAHDALYSLHTQYLYDEIEAETNLVIDQLYFLLSDVIYSYFKNLAGSTLLEKSYKSRLEEIKTLVALTHNNGAGLHSSHHLTQNIQQFETLLQQKHVHLLGRSINFNYILGQNINNKIYRDIDLAIKRFESSDARGVIDLKQLLDVISTAHGFLSQYIQLDSFDLMLNEINESFNPSSFKGRISIHMLTSLVKDIIPNYSYNYYTERFIPSPMMMRQMEYIKGPKQSAVANAYGVVCAKAFDMQSKLTRSYFGYHHFVAFLSLGVNLTDLSMLIDQIIKNMLDKIKDISEYLEALKDSIPPCKPLPFSYHCIGSYGYYEGKLKTLLSYDDLKSEVFQNFREVGNSISLLKDLSNILDIQKQYDFNFIAPLLGLVPSVKKGSNSGASKGNNAEDEEKVRAIDSVSPIEIIASHMHAEVSQSATAQNNVLRSVDVFNKLPAAIHRQIQNSTSLFADIADVSGNSATAGAGGAGKKSLFKFVLMQVEDFLYQQSLTSDWSIQNNSASGVVDVNNAKGFHRLWSALNFLFAMSEDSAASTSTASESEEGGDEASAISNEAEFGHGFAVTGCLLLHLLGQKSVFELMDFSYYILSINHYDVKAEYQAPTPSATADPSSRSSVKKSVDVASSLVKDTNNFIGSATTQQMLHKELFALFEAQYNVKVANLSNTVNKTIFHPPVDEE